MIRPRSAVHAVRLALLLLAVALGLLPVARAADPRVSVVAAPPGVDGSGRVQVVLGDDAQRAVKPDPEAAFRAEVGAGSARVTGARSLISQGEPVQTILAFDQSGSFKKHWGHAFTLARELAGALPAKKHRTTVLTFGVQLEDHGTAETPSELPSRLDAARRQGAIQGYTRLRSFIRDAITRADAELPAARGGLRRVVVFTDAGEESTAYSVADVVDHARERGVAVHIVAFYKPSNTAAKRLDEVKRIAESTGGRFVQVSDVDAARPAMKAIARTGARTWWLDLAYCGVPDDQGDRFDDEVEIEVWSAGARLAASKAYPFRQHAAGDAVTACPSAAAPATATDTVPEARPWWKTALLVGLPLLLFLLALLALLVFLWTRRRRDTPEPTRPAPPAPEPPPAEPSRAPVRATPFAPVSDDDWEDPLERLPERALVQVSAPAGVRRRVRLTKKRFTVGGDPDQAPDLLLDVAQVSGHHATLLVFGNGHLFVRDENSTNGTYVDGQRVAPGAKVQLSPGQTVSFSQQVVYRLESGAQADPPPPRSPEPAPEAPAPRPKPRTIISPVGGDESGGGGPR